MPTALLLRIRRSEGGLRFTIAAPEFPQPFDFE